MTVVYDSDKYFENRGSIFTIYDSKWTEIPFVQDKISKSYQGVIRGFHGDNQTWKLIVCLHGRIKLVTHDIDTGLTNRYILDGDDQNCKSILVPPRVLNAHQCLSSMCIFYYKWSHRYTTPEDQWSVNFNDQHINPEWITSYPFIVSNRDQNSPSLQELKKQVC